MSTVQDIRSTLGINAGATQGASRTADSQDRFLKLLVTQMQNQDPLNPMENAEVTTQLAQLNTVNGINRLNETMSSMAASISAQQSLQAAMLVGREVMVEGSRLNFGGQPVQFGVELPGGADRVTLTIADRSGNVVDTVESGAQPAGTLVLGWNGVNAAGDVVASGDYVVSAQVFNGGQAVGATTLVGARVDSVGHRADGAVELQLAGAGNVGIVDIKRFL